MGELDTQDKHYASLALRATPHALRDRLTVEEATRGKTAYEVKPSRVAAATQTFTQVVEVPRRGKGTFKSIRGSFQSVIGRPYRTFGRPRTGDLPI